MSITRSVQQEKQLAIFTVSGTPSFEELMEVLKHFYEKHPTRDLLWDLRNGTIESLYYDELDTLSDYVQQSGEVRAGGKTAFVVSRGLDYGVIKMIGTFMEIKNIPIQTMRFHSMEKAVQWLEEEN